MKKKQRKTKYIYMYHSAWNGWFVTAAYAKMYPSTTFRSRRLRYPGG